MQPHVPDLPRVEESVQQLEDSSEDSKDSQDVEPEQENMNMDKKLPNLMKLSSSFVVDLLVKSWESSSVCLGRYPLHYT